MVTTQTALLASWLLGILTAHAPVATHRYTGASDSKTMARYEGIANDLADVVSEPDQEPLFKGTTGRAKTALLALAIASLESGGFRADVDTTKPSGDCRGGSGPTCQGGHFHATCLAQVWVRPGEKLENRKDCFRIQLSRIRESFHSCPALPTMDKLRVYASGSCEKGAHESEVRMKRAMAWWTAHEFFPAIEVEAEATALQ